MSAHWHQRREAGGRFAIWLIRAAGLHAGRAFARAWLYPITLYFFFRRTRERRDSREFLDTALGRPAHAWDILRHIHSYAATILDRIYLLHDTTLDRFDVRVHGLEQIENEIAHGRGVLLLGAHFGSFEALRALSLRRPEVKLRVVMDLKQTRALNELLHALNPEVANNVIDAGVDPGALALSLHEAAQQGALIGLLADRARGRGDRHGRLLRPCGAISGSGLSDRLDARPAHRARVRHLSRRQPLRSALRNAGGQREDRAQRAQRRAAGVGAALRRAPGALHPAIAVQLVQFL